MVLSLIDRAKVDDSACHRFLFAVFKEAPLPQPVDNCKTLLPWNIDFYSK